MNDVILTIIVAVYNTEKYLNACLDSIVGQTIKNREIIIVNDGSTDNSVSIINEYKHRFSDIIVVNKLENEGLLLCRLEGMKIARGRFVGFIDSDDFIDTSMYEQLVSTASVTGADIVECLHKNVNNCNSYQDIHFPLSTGEIDRMTRLSLHCNRNYGSTLWRCIFKNVVCQRTLQCFENVEKKTLLHICNEDEFLFPLFLMSANKYYVLEKHLYYYRVIREGSVMNQIATDNHKKLQHAKVLLKASHFIEKVCAEKNKTFIFRKNVFNLHMHNICNAYKCAKLQRVDVLEISNEFNILINNLLKICVDIVRYDFKSFCQFKTFKRDVRVVLIAIEYACKKLRSCSL